MKQSCIARILVFFFCLTQAHQLFADAITINNESSQPWSFAVYYVNDNAERATDIYTIQAGETKEIERPPRKNYENSLFSFYDRELTLGSNELDLEETLSTNQFHKLTHGNIGSKWGSTFYIVNTTSGVEVLNAVEKAIKPIGSIIETEQDTIALNNESPQAYYFAVYYVSNTGHKATEIDIIQPGEIKQIERPGRKLFTTIPPVYFDRELVISAKEEDLEEKLSINQLDLLKRGNIGSKWGSQFYIIDVSKNTKVVSIFEKTIDTTLDKLITQKVPNPHIDKSAVVRYGNELCPEEALYRKKRLPKVNTALTTLLNEEITIEKTPTIAVACSGGGIRASLFSTGWLSGAYEEGLLDTLTYAVGLSGSTWSIGSLITTGKAVPDFREFIIQQADRITTQNLNDYGRVTWTLLAKEAYGQVVSPVDFYGGLLANRFLGSVEKNREFIGLSAQQSAMNSTDMPFPIYTAVGADNQTLKKWYEFTPYEVGAPWLGQQGMYVSSWALGRNFSQGNSTDHSIELPFAHAMGIFGSAFSVSIAEALEHIPGLLPFGGESLELYAEKYVEQLLSLQEESEFITSMGNTRIASGKTHNFTRGIKDSPIKDLVNMKFVDAGVAFNLPYPPISGQRPERQADIIIFVDASSDLVNAPTLKKVEDYARQNKLPFPEISEDTYKKLDQRTATVIKGIGNQPTIIYMPFARDNNLDALLAEEQYAEYNKELKDFDPKQCTEQEFCKTTNFRYKENTNQARKVVLQAEFNVKANIELIKQAIREAIQK